MVDILIVHDSAAIRGILQRVLRQANVPVGTVHEAGDGEEALSRLSASKVGLILSALNMPGMDGLELLTRLKSSEEFRLTPVVIVTRESNPKKMREATELGAAAYLRTPFHTDQIKQNLAGFFQ